MPVKMMILPDTGIIPVPAAAPPANSKTANKGKTSLKAVFFKVTKCDLKQVWCLSVAE